MTSKEALKYLLVNSEEYLLVNSEELYNQYEEDEKFYLEAVELYNIVLKDLEILEILKNVFNYKSVQEFVDNMTKDDFFRVKEWLENDRNKRIH